MTDSTLELIMYVSAIVFVVVAVGFRLHSHWLDEAEEAVFQADRADKDPDASMRGAHRAAARVAGGRIPWPLRDWYLRRAVARQGGEP